MFYISIKNQCAKKITKIINIISNISPIHTTQKITKLQIIYWQFLFKIFNKHSNFIVKNKTLLKNCFKMKYLCTHTTHSVYRLKTLRVSANFIILPSKPSHISFTLFVWIHYIILHNNTIKCVKTWNMLSCCKLKKSIIISTMFIIFKTY